MNKANKQKHGQDQDQVEVKKKKYSRKDEFMENTSNSNQHYVQKVRKAQHGKLTEVKYISNNDQIGNIDFLDEIKSDIFTVIKQNIKEFGMVRVHVNVEAVFKKLHKEEDNEKEIQNDVKFSGIEAMEISSSRESIEAFYEKMKRTLEEDQEISKNESGLTFIQYKTVQFGIAAVQLLTGGSKYIDLPEKLENRRACINVKNVDDECFRYAVWVGVEHIKSLNADDGTEEVRLLDY